MPTSPRLAVDVYPVGALADLLSAWGHLRGAWGRGASPSGPPWRWRLGKAVKCVAHLLRTVARHVGAREWRALKNTFNGYLAEPYAFPPGDYHRRCGTGWTRQRAMRSLHRRLPEGFGNVR